LLSQLPCLAHFRLLHPWTDTYKPGTGVELALVAACCTTLTSFVVEGDCQYPGAMVDELLHTLMHAPSAVPRCLASLQQLQLPFTSIRNLWNLHFSGALSPGCKVFVEHLGGDYGVWPGGAAEVAAYLANACSEAAAATSRGSRAPVSFNLPVWHCDWVDCDEYSDVHAFAAAMPMLPGVHVWLDLGLANILDRKSGRTRPRWSRAQKAGAKVAVTALAHITLLEVTAVRHSDGRERQLSDVFQAVRSWLAAGLLPSVHTLRINAGQGVSVDQDSCTQGLLSLYMQATGLGRRGHQGASTVGDAAACAGGEAGAGSASAASTRQLLAAAAASGQRLLSVRLHALRGPELPGLRQVVHAVCARLPDPDAQLIWARDI